jgi:parallel beta-helix repeat protein
MELRILKRYLICTLLVLLTILLTAKNSTVIEKSRNEEMIRISKNAYTESAPILIDDDSDFVSHGFSGAGTETNPYIIENLNITADATCISIVNTTSYFIIKDCLLTPLSYGFYKGIDFYEVENGRVENCTFENFEHGIGLGLSRDVIISGNTFRYCKYGITVAYSTSCSVLGNSVNMTESDSITGIWSNNTFVSGNTILHSSNYGIIIQNSLWTKVVTNTINHTHAMGIEFSNSNHSIAENNTICHQGWDGSRLGWNSY